MSETMIVGAIGGKGGIGKTTVAGTLAAAAVQRGLRVLLIDADTQGNTTMMVNVARGANFKALIADDAEWADVIRMAPITFAGGPLAIIPGGAATEQLARDRATPGRILERFRELAAYGTFDLVVVDTSPGVTEIHAGVYFGCTHVFLPTHLQHFAIAGLKDTMAYLETAAAAGRRAGYPVAETLGIVVNQHMAREAVQNQIFGWLLEQHGPRLVREPIPHATVWEKAVDAAQSIYMYAPTTPTAMSSARRARAKFDLAVWAPVAQAMGVQA